MRQQTLACNERQVVVIVGTPKSGTTFLLALFDGHESVLTVLESGLFHFERLADTFSLEAIDAFLADKYSHLSPSFERGRFLEHLRARAQREGLSTNTVLGAVSDHLLELAGREASWITHVVEKTPSHFKCADEIFKLYPSARVIHMLRDPRDNYLSLKRRMRNPESALYQRPDYHPLLFIENRMLESLDAAVRNVKRYPDRYRILFYEDLILGGTGAIASVAEWIGLPWRDVLRSPTRDGEPWSGNSFSRDLSENLSSFDARPIGRWRHEITAREVRIAERIIRTFGLERVYAPEYERRSPRPVFLDLLAPFQDEVRLELSKSTSARRLVSNARAYVNRRVRIGHKLDRTTKSDWFEGCTLGRSRREEQPVG